MGHALRLTPTLHLVVLLLFPSVGWGRPPDVYLLLVDTLRRDHLGP